MPNRIIKESVRISEKINALSDFEYRLWSLLIISADDFGRGDARAAVIKGFCFPLRDVSIQQIENGLQALAKCDCIRLYESAGKQYFFFPRWEEHQRVRNKHSKCPEPNLTADCGQMSADCNNLLPESNPIQSESESESNKESNPTLADVADFCLKNDLDVDALAFWSQYEESGWKIGGKPIKNWRGLLISFGKEKKNGNAGNNSGKGSKWNIKYSNG